MACQKLCKQGRDVHESKGQHIGKAPSLHLFTLQLHSAWGNVSQVHWQLVGVAHSQATSSSNVAWDRTRL